MWFQRIAAPLCAAFALCAASSVCAAPVTLSFSGEITRVEDSGAGLSLGDAFTASFTYDNASPFISFVKGDTTRALYYTGSISAVVAGKSFSATESPQLQVLDNNVNGANIRDDFFLSAENTDNNGAGPGQWLLQIDMPDLTGLFLNSTDIPDAAKVQQMLTSGGRLFVRRFSNGVTPPYAEEGFAMGVFVAPSQNPDPGPTPHPGPHNVPEPASLVLVLSALASLALRRGR